MINKIRQKREALGWGVRELAQRVNSNISSVSRWENSQQLPRPMKRRQLAEALNCTVTDLFPEILNQDERGDAQHVDWLRDAWKKRWVVAVYGWFNIAKLITETQNDLTNLDEFIVTNEPLEMIVIPSNEVKGAPGLFSLTSQGNWIETQAFIEFENFMFAIFREKGLLINNVAFWHHESGVSIQPQFGRERESISIMSALMTDAPNHEKQIINLSINNLGPNVR